MNVVGLDLSLSSTGIANDAGARCVRVKSTGMQRLHEIRSQVLIACQTADVVMIEGYAIHAKFGHVHERAELGGLIRYGLWRLGIPFAEVPPMSLKLFATGRGNAKKEDVLAAAIRRLGYQGSSNDETDALWLRAMALHFYGVEAVDLPKPHYKALDKIDWPPPRAAVSA